MGQFVEHVVGKGKTLSTIIICLLLVAVGTTGAARSQLVNYEAAKRFARQIGQLEGATKGCVWHFCQIENARRKARREILQMCPRGAGISLWNPLSAYFLKCGVAADQLWDLERAFDDEREAYAALLCSFVSEDETLQKHRDMSETLRERSRRRNCDF